MENDETQEKGSNIRTLFPQGLKKPNLNLNIGFSWKIKALLTLIVIVVVAYSSLLEYVKPNEFGIKVVQIGFNRGVQKKVYNTGLHLVLPFGMQQMHKLPRDLQVLELTNYHKTASQYARIKSAAHIQTSDGFFVDVDVSIIYRIVDPYNAL